MLSFLRFVIYYYLASLYGKLIGALSHVYIPRFLRPLIIGWYAWRTGSRLYEAVKPNYSDYSNIHEFFTREIKPRPIDPTHELVSPVDGNILSVGRLDKNSYRIEQIKGIKYKMEETLGLTQEELQALKNSKKNLYFCSIHLPKSECHLFRSPAEWVVKSRTHVPGTMYSLARMKQFENPYIFYNERVVVRGEWKHGAFFFVPFGSVEASSIILNFDEKLHTNRIGESRIKEEPGEKFRDVECNGSKFHARYLEYRKPIYLSRGEVFGHFQRGSAFVMVFEHEDPDFEFSITPPMFLMYGQPLCKKLK